MIDIFNLSLKHIFVTLGNVSNHEINQNDEQENDNNYPENPDEEDHYFGLKWIVFNNSSNFNLRAVLHILPKRYTWRANLPNRVQEIHDEILED